MSSGFCDDIIITYLKHQWRKYIGILKFSEMFNFQKPTIFAIYIIKLFVIFSKGYLKKKKRFLLKYISNEYTGNVNGHRFWLILI